MVQPQLPLELWLYIVQFIPEPILCRRLLEVNKFFYEISMDLRYRRVKLQTLSPATSKILSRLSDPHVGKRVRFLTVSPDFRYYGQQTRPDTLRNRLTDVLHYALGWTVTRPEEEATRALMDALPGLTNVTRLTIDSHSWGSHSGPDLPRFLDMAWSSFSDNLKKLSLRGHAASFHTIINSGPNFPVLEELFFELIDNPLNHDTNGSAEILIKDLAPFINSFASQLQALTLCSWGTLDLSNFFLELGEFPLLTIFNLQTAFPKTIADPSGLANFLERHCSQLERLVLKLNTTPLGLNIELEEPLGRWLKECILSVKLNKLRELHMYPTVHPEGMEALVSSIQLSNNTLTKLIVRDKYLEPQEVETIVIALPPDLRFLRLNIRLLTPELFDVLHRLSGLQSLALYIGNVSADFATNMESRLYADWKLEDIGVWHSGSLLERHLMSSISRCIPSISSFWGTGTLQSAENDVDDVTFL